jgi:hypothetical protein
MLLHHIAVQFLSATILHYVTEAVQSLTSGGGAGVLVAFVT